MKYMIKTTDRFWRIKFQLPPQLPLNLTLNVLFETETYAASDKVA